MNVRRCFLLALVFACHQAAYIVPGSAAGAAQVKGRILAPTGAKCGTFAYPEALLETGASIEHVFTYRFPVAPATRGTAFSLKSKRKGVDLDLWFTGSSSKRFATRNFGGETGIVPAGAMEAHVCLHVGAAASFVYKAGL